jgi:hypothetical protein
LHNCRDYVNAIFGFDGMGAMIQNMTADYAIRRIEHAGATLRCLRIRSPSTLLARGRIEILQEVGTDMAPDRTRLAYPVPSARDVSLMDEALSWIGLIPNQVKRRVVSMRSQFHPYQEKNIISWRRCGDIIGADHKTVKIWHGQAIDLIARALRGTEIKSPSGCNIVPDHVQLHWLES